MDKNIKLALLGGDARQSCLASMLAERGFECAVGGMASGGHIGGSVRCRDWRCAVNSASAVILPLPATMDGVTVNCPYCENEDRLKFNTLLDACTCPIFGGKFGDTFLAAASARDRRIIDYFDSESLQIRNATPTAEGAISIAMQHLNKTVCGCRAVVTGYGRIGRMLVHLLRQLGADVTVAARNYRQLAEASSFGNSTFRLSPDLPSVGLSQLCEKGMYDVIFNTVPARLFDKEIIDELPPDVLLIDLASVPGGVDFAAAKDRGIKAIWALSLPGKYAPESAGKIIGETLLEYFEREGIT